MRGLSSEGQEGGNETLGESEGDPEVTAKSVLADLPHVEIGDHRKKTLLPRVIRTPPLSIKEMVSIERKQVGNVRMRKDKGQ